MSGDSKKDNSDHSIRSDHSVASLVALPVAPPVASPVAPPVASPEPQTPVSPPRAPNTAFQPKVKRRIRKISTAAHRRSRVAPKDNLPLAWSAEAFVPASYDRQYYNLPIGYAGTTLDASAPSMMISSGYYRSTPVERYNVPAFISAPDAHIGTNRVSRTNVPMRPRDSSLPQTPAGAFHLSNMSVNQANIAADNR